ncbi:MAG: sulfatase, partial [Acidobacteriota bacterium]
LVVRPTDEESAQVEIQSIRVIFRKEHLLSTPTGVSWQGLENVFRECLVSRSPETITYTVHLPPEPWLDLAIGSLEEGPVTFAISIKGSEETLLRKTLTTPHRWEPVPIDLRNWSNRTVELAFQLESPQNGTLGIWGAPVIRSRANTQAQSSPRESALGAPPRGVILIVADTLRRDHLNAYGYERPTAPTLAKLASEGVLFADNQSQATWTKVSVSSILTSLYPTTHGVVSGPDRISAAAVTAAEAFRSAGYATWASSSVVFSGQSTNLHQGVEVLYERLSVPEQGSKTARPFIDLLLPWLKDHKDSPFFVFLHVFDPHSPFEPRPPYNHIWMDGQEREHFIDWTQKVKDSIENDAMRSRELPSRAELEKAGIDPAEYVRSQHGWYDGSIRGMDDEIARVLEALEGLGLRDDTLIAFLSDHGEEFLEHGHPWHGRTVYGEMTNVPMMLNWPGRLSAGTVIEDTVQSIDLLPTLLEISGLEIPELYQGESLVPYFSPNGESQQLEDLQRRPVFSERRTPSGAQEETAMRDAFAVVQDGWKLIHNTVRPEGINEYELFDHNNDPLNLKDVAAEQPEVVQRLAAVLNQWLEEAAAARLSPDEDTEGLSPAELQQLRALGYVQ